MSEAAAVIDAGVDAGAAPDDASALEIAAAPAAVDPAVVADPANDNWLPEKHVVKKEDGTIDLEASARKQADAYRALEKRIGTGDIPPKTAEEYAPEITVEGFDLEELKSDELYKDFAAKALAEGYTNKQFSLAVNEFLPRVAEMMQAEATLKADDCTAKLKEIWPTDNEYKVNTANALRVVNAYASSSEKAKVILKAIGNNPEAIELLAAIGPELEEGKAPNGAAPGMVDIEALQKSKAYWDPSEPDHESVKARVERYYAEKYPKK